MVGSSRREGGRRYISTSWGRANWGMRVSSLVDTTTVRVREGSTCAGGGQRAGKQGRGEGILPRPAAGQTAPPSRSPTPLLPPCPSTPAAAARRTCMTSLRVVALLQSLLSSRQRMMYSFCSILVRTMASTWRALFCSVELRLPGAAEMRPARGQAAGKFEPAFPNLAGVYILRLTIARAAPAVLPFVPAPITQAPSRAPGVSMMVRLGQNLYSMRTTISFDQNWDSRSSRAFSFSM